MFKIFSKNRYLFASYILIFLGLSIFLFVFGKKETHLILSTCHNGVADAIMKVFTFFGDGLFMVIVGVIMLLKSYRRGLIILSSFLVSSLLVQILKRYVFIGYKRPVSWFHEQGIELYRISGIEYHSIYSFPSGHTTTAFALFFLLAFFVKSNLLKFAFLVMAIITAYSRIYLSQHFLGDTLAGSVLGIGTAIFMEKLFEKKEESWMDRGLIKSFVNT